MRSVLAFCVVAVIILAQPTTAQEPQSFSEHFRAYNAAIEEGDFGLALSHAEEAYRLGLEQFGKGSKEHAVLAYNLGYASSRAIILGRREVNEKAKSYLLESIEVYEDLYGRNAVELIDPLLELAASGFEDNNIDASEALPLYRRALGIIRKHMGRDILWAQIALEYGNLATSKSDPDAHRSARTYLLRAHEVFAELAGATHFYTGLTAFALGKLYAADRKFKRAEEYLLEALTILEPHSENLKETLSLVHGHLVMVYENRGEDEKSTEHLVAMGRLYPDHDTKSARPVFRPAMKFPDRALRANKEGSVMVEFTVTSEGRVKDPKIIEGDVERYFKDAILKYVVKLRYAPRVVNGRAIDDDGYRFIFSFEIIN